jgi:hypothetical protein
MVYLVGGYILTVEQVFAFATRNGFEIPTIDVTTLCSNRWLRSQGVPFRLLAASYKGQPRVIWLLGLDIGVMKPKTTSRHSWSALKIK